MPSREEVAYFGAGPAPLPTAVLERGSQAFLNFENTGLSLAEISHRSSTANKVLADTKQALIELLDIPESYDVLLMHGGGSGEFSAVVFNLVAVWVEKRRRRAMKDLDGDEQAVVSRVSQEVRKELRLDYIVTGSWSLKASQEAALLLEPLGKDLVNVAVDARKGHNGNFGTIPDESSWNLTGCQADGKESAFVYYCDNETVDGVEYSSLPKCFDDKSENLPFVVADMSSNFLSRKVDVKNHTVIFVSSLISILPYRKAHTSFRVVLKRISALRMSPSSLSARIFLRQCLHHLSCMLLAFGPLRQYSIGLSSQRITHCITQCPSLVSGSLAK